MSETKLITTVTDLIVSGEDIAIKTSYLDTSLLPDTILARIADSDGNENGINYKAGDLLLKEIHSPEHIHYSIDNNGHLILTLNTGDILNYSIDSNGHLIYTITL